MKFVFDIDGTLCFDGHTISEELRAVLATAGHYGHELVFATARSYRDCLGLLTDSLKDSLVIALNGGLAYDKGQVIFEKNIDLTDYKSIIHWCQDANLPYFVDDDFDYATARPEKMPFVASVDPLQKAQQKNWDQLTHPIKMVIYMGDHEELLQDLEEDIRALKGVSVFYHEEEKCLYINPEETTKASTVEELCGDAVVAFGNDKNDRHLLKQALYGVQVGSYAGLTRYADEQIELKGDYQAAIAARIIALFKEFEGK